MNNQLSPDGEFPACGYGLSGLCCSACLSGPCRISPFDRDAERGKCGASADLLVAGNLLRMIGVDAAGRLADLAHCVHRVRATSAGRPAASPVNPKIAREILDKYGLEEAEAGKADGIGRLAGKAEDLLAVNLPARDLSPVWSRLYPENIFPQFYSGRILPAASLTLVGLSAFQGFHKPDAARKDILQACLKVALVYMICDELIQDLEILQGGETARGVENNELKAAETLDPDLPPKGVIMISTAVQGLDGLERNSEIFRNQWPGPLVELSRCAGLLAISRQIYRHRSRPPAETEPLVVVFSASAALVVGTLVCGYTVVSRPGLPLYGSDSIRRFFSEDLRQIFGAVYLPPEAGDMLSVAQDYFRKET